MNHSNEFKAIADTYHLNDFRLLTETQPCGHISLRCI